ncbi:bacterioferritin [Nitrosomonas sp.]|uniref:ferritin-like domain-containing protein n=1 Tax=Nitrosomonas sp. TaxID=42353 RepID=UPI001DE7BAD2|nr:ferritin-like domain-containing protein [Nitrosomonas sp.]MCB1949045.1 ferritin [Nitrosomonas sp.]MCP5244341.1 ferritin [Burkholderiales bacterium]MDR4514511.1 ferritin [Nitrosomonas sp.]
MSVDSRTLGWLTRALTHEMSAVQQYLAQSTLARLRGEPILGEKLRQEAMEELEHAERLMEHLILCGVSPSAGNLTPARLGRNWEELMMSNRMLEVNAVHLYRDALLHAQRTRDGETAALLESILNDEIAHINKIDDMRAEQNELD